MATKIFTEILIIILKNVQSTQDLRSSLLVNRFWCKVTTPILWELTLCQDLHWINYKKMRKKSLFIRTYLSCMDTQARTLITQNGFDLSSSPPHATFDYPSFIRDFRIENLAYFISIYSQKIIVSYLDNYYNNNNKSIIIKSRILFYEICKLIINRCTFLDSFKLTRVPKLLFENFLNSDLICSILKLPSASKIFKKLETFVSATINDELTRPLYESLALICDNFLNMDLEFKSESQVLLLEKLIGVQKRLENLSITDNGYINSNSLLCVIINQKRLKRLRLISLRFYNFEEKSSPIGQSTSLQELYIENCSGLYKLDCLFFASLFTQLSSFRLRNTFDAFPRDFIIKIFETANVNLKNICLDLCQRIPSDVVSAILNYCKKITELVLCNLSSEQVIVIFNNNFNDLRRFSFDCVKGLNANKLLCQMGESVPESLETVEIRMGIFSADSLRKFFEGWCRKGVGGNKKMIVKRQVRRRKLSDEHRKIIEKYGTELYCLLFKVSPWEALWQ
ncbi:2300_t:CDS:2 [Diversispora eburnea]|uniref:2300_t:CDS:1 n=1 Tax=Diversispora eburnea TaxID=1213867 RepID=A0A9N9FPZ4_9GLOM|nr:2300_t:CDS:2 [Diversispora eburnea]